MSGTTPKGKSETLASTPGVFVYPFLILVPTSSFLLIRYIISIL